MTNKQPVGATHLMTGTTDSPWRDLSGSTWKYLNPCGEWCDTGKDTASFFERNAHRLESVSAERDSSVADAALWLYQNREQVSEGWLRGISVSNLVNAESMARTHDKAAAGTPLAIIRRLSEGDRENEYSEKEHFVADHLLQLGAGCLDDDANVYGVTLYQLVRLLTDYQAPAFTKASIMSLSVTVGMTDELKAAFAQLEAYGPGELVVATPGVAPLAPQPSTTLLRECVELLSMYDTGGGSREGVAVEELRALIAARPDPQPPTSR